MNTTTKRGQARGAFLSQQARLRHIGEHGVTKSGRVMTIIEWRTKYDLDIQFDDGYIAEHKRYDAFKLGSIYHPDDGKFGEKWKYENRLGESVTKPNGDIMTITTWITSHNFYVTFTNGEVKHCTCYTDFKVGKIRNPNGFADQHIGEETIAKNGLHARIIAAENWNCVTIQFEDGVTVTTDYKAFIQQKIKHPDLDVRILNNRKKYLGNTYTDRTGLKYTVVEYKDNRNMTVEYEDGFRMVIGTDKIRKNYIRHPFPHNIGIICMDKPAYTFGDQGNFYCHCTKCGIRDIMTIDEMKSHICNI